MQNSFKNANKICIISGPCAIENDKQILQVCECLNGLNLSWIRAGAFKPRMNPHSFQGMGVDALKIISPLSKKYNLKTVSEVVDEQSLDIAMKYVDALQIGTRNMSNYSLLKMIGKRTSNNKIPIVFKRGMSSKISEWLSACDYISESGNNNILLCERGLRTFEDTTRFTLDISAVPVIHKQCNYPICVDVSHAAGNSYLVPDLAKAAVASGADALMIEVHPDPKSAKCDGAQQLNLSQFESLVEQLKVLAKAMGKIIV